MSQDKLPDEILKMMAFHVETLIREHNAKMRVYGTPSRDISEMSRDLAQAAWSASPGPGLIEALQWFVAQKGSFDAMHGNQADAYYHFIKQDEAWERTRAAIAKATGVA